MLVPEGHTTATRIIAGFNVYVQKYMERGTGSAAEYEFAASFAFAFAGGGGGAA